MTGPSTPTSPTTSPATPTSVATTTPTSDPLDVLLASDAWGTRLLLERCRPLTHKQFHQRFEIGLGSLHDTLSHIVGVVRRWCDRLAARPLRPALNKVANRPDIVSDARDRTPDDLLLLHEEASRDLAAIARDLRSGGPDGKGLDGLLSLQWPGEDGQFKTYTFTRGAVLVHVATHGTHHRAQCINMMRHLNVPGLSDRLPDPSVVDWQSAMEVPPSRNG